MKTQIWSNGGGVQSAAIAAAIVSGKLEKPDLCAIVDTEREGSKTWEYLDAVIKPALESVGVEMHKIGKSDYATVDLYGGKENDKLLVPVFTNFSGEVGKLPTYCSNEWKKRVLRRWANEQGISKDGAEVWIGFSIDEMKRCYQELGKWQPRYPLIELRMSRSDCIRLVKDLGWPEPPRSACWMCPNKPIREWEELQRDSPEDFQKAVEFEREIRKQDDTIFLTQECKPLDECTFNDQRDLFETGRCTSGMCDT